MRSVLLALLALLAGECVLYAQELRAMWVDAFHAGLRNSTETSAVIAAARAANCNAVFVQVRKRGDAYYRNGLEPVAVGVTAGFDPLADLIQRGHTGTPRVEVHAWFVTYNIWNSEATVPSQATHPYNLHPEWLSVNHSGEQWDGSNYQFDQGHPEVQQYTFDVMMDVLSRYDVDGIHFDYVRYSDDIPSGSQPWGYHPVSVNRYRQLLNLSSAIPIASVVPGNPGTVHTIGAHGLDTGDTVTISGNSGSTPSINGTRVVTRIDADTFTLSGLNVTNGGTGGSVTFANPTPGKSSWLQWRRDQVTALVRKVYLNAWATKPNVRVSAALIAYGNAPANLNLSTWQAKEAYSRVLQDWRGWMEEGILDLGCPMVYKNESTNTSFGPWAEFIKERQYNRAAGIGMGWYLNGVGDTITQIKATRTASSTGRTAAGLLGYSYAVPTSDGSVSPATMRAALVDDATAEIYDSGGSPVFPTAVNPPSMPWKTNMTKGHVMGVIRDSLTGYAFDGISVALTGPVNRTLLSDGTGFFGSVDLPVGNYTVNYSVPGFRPLQRSFSVTGAAVAQPSLELTPLPFEITTCHPMPGSLRITWNSIPGRTYRIERSENLSSWEMVQAGVPAVERASSTTYTTPIPAAWDDRAFVRVVQEN